MRQVRHNHIGVLYLCNQLGYSCILHMTHHAVTRVTGASRDMDDPASRGARLPRDLARFSRGIGRLPCGNRT